MVARYFALIAAVAGYAAFAAPAGAAEYDVARGKYLVQFGGCTDCHTPGHFFGKPDMAKFLAGSDVGFSVPGLGVFAGSNLTPDNATGLGKWTPAQIATAITTGVRPDGRMLAPSMPWRGFAGLTKSDAMAIATYLKSLKPVSNKIAGPFGPSETPTGFVLTIMPAEAFAGLPKPK